MKLIFSRLPLFALLSLGLFLAGCPTTHPPSEGEGYTTRQILIQRAENILSEASRQSSPRKEQLMLEAAEIFFREEQPDRAQPLLDAIDNRRLTLEPLARHSLLGAELALADDNFFKAHDLLTHPALERHWRELPITMQQRWHSHRADLFDLLGEEQRSLNEYIALSDTLTDANAITDVHQRLWQTLSRIPQQTLQGLISSEKNRVRRGWYTLAGISRNSQGDIHRLQSEIKGWQQSWSWHPGALYPPAGLNTIERIARNLPKQLALMLPLNDKEFGNAASAIQDGFLTAYYDVIERGGTPPAIRIYDTTGSEDVTTTYQQAIADGAELVIGPLKRENITALNRFGELPVPTISLSYPEDELSGSTSNLFLFGLSAADEARQAAQRAWLEGHRRALAITPQGSLGERTLAAFKNEWESRGGNLVTATPYPKTQVDFSPVIKPALLVNQSEARTKRLSKLLGKPLKSSPERRRLDLDMVFMLATPEHARQIKPMLDFFYAGDLPVYATSRIYTGIAAPGDRDLEKVRFSAMPWTLPGTVAEKMKPDTSLLPVYQQLFALGLDAYHIHQGVLQMQALPNTRLFGSTGTLRLEKNRILREQPWAEFRAGKVRRARKPSES